MVQQFRHKAAEKMQVHRRGTEIAEKYNYSFLLRGQKCIRTDIGKPCGGPFCFPSSQRETKNSNLCVLCGSAVK